MNTILLCLISFHTYQHRWEVQRSWRSWIWCQITLGTLSRDRSKLARVNATGGIINFAVASVLCDISLKKLLTFISTTQWLNYLCQGQGRDVAPSQSSSPVHTPIFLYPVRGAHPSRKQSLTVKQALKRSWRIPQLRTSNGFLKMTSNFHATGNLELLRNHTTVCG